MSSKSTDITSSLSQLGSKSKVNLQNPSAEILESFPNRFPNRHYVICMDFPEFTSLCPVTGQPDFATIKLEYIPNQFCVESKSFKLYMFAFRSHQSFMETVTNNILDDLVQTLEPHWIRVTGLFAPRGATKISVVAEHFQAEDPKQNAPKIWEQVQAWKSEIHNF